MNRRPSSIWALAMSPLIVVSRASLDKIMAFKRRDKVGGFPWVSTGDGDFNRDFGVSFAKEANSPAAARKYNFGTAVPHGEENPGLSLFYKDPSGGVFHTYSAYGRGLEALLPTYAVLDRAPMGRDEAGLPMPMAWVRHHDKYEPTLVGVASCCHGKESH